MIINAARMVTDLVLETGWQVDHILNMPARRFFCLKKHIQEIKKDDEVHRMLALCDIQAISWGGADYLKDLKRSYKQLLIPSTAPRKMLASKMLDADNKADTDIVAKNLKAAFDTKARLMGIER